MLSLAWTTLFAAALVVSLGLRTWLATRQCRHVAAHRNVVPTAFEASIPLAAHQKAAGYTLARARFGNLHAIFGAAVLLGWTLFGGLDLLNGVVRDLVLPRWGGLAYEVALVVAFGLVAGAFELPFELYATFGLEERFGFNRMTWQLWLADALKGFALSLVIGVPLLALVLWIMAATGGWWWLLAWGVWVGFNLLAFVLGPTVIAPLFNRFVKLEDESLIARVQALMARAGFALKGLFVMDGSRRSAHANAYFTGFGQAKRVVFFDTLLSLLDTRRGRGRAGPRARPLRAPPPCSSASSWSSPPACSSSPCSAGCSSRGLVLQRPRRRASTLDRAERCRSPCSYSCWPAPVVRLLRDTAVRPSVAPARVRGRCLCLPAGQRQRPGLGLAQAA